MLKKVLFGLMLAGAAFLPFAGSQASAKEADQLARVHWNININTGFYPCYPPGPCFGYPYPYGYPLCPYPYPAPCWCW